MKLFDFLKILTKEKFPFNLEYIEFSKTIKVSVNTFSDIEIFEFNENGIESNYILKEINKSENPKVLSNNIKNLVNRPEKSWIEASIDLGIRFISPYKFTGIDNIEYEATGLLPDFGWGKGVLITSRKTDEDVFVMANLLNEYFLTSLSPIYYDKYNRENTIETLSDWGWIGKGIKPDWLIDPKK